MHEIGIAVDRDYLPGVTLGCVEAFLVVVEVSSSCRAFLVVFYCPQWLQWVDPQGQARVCDVCWVFCYRVGPYLCLCRRDGFGDLPVAEGIGFQ